MIKKLYSALHELELFSAASIMFLRVSMLAGKFLLALFIAKFIGLEALGLYGLIGGASAIIQMVMRLGVFSSISRTAVNQPLNDLTQNLRHYGTGVAVLYLAALPLAIGAGWYFERMDLVILSFIIIIFEHIGMDVFTLANNIHRPKLANILLSVQSASWIYLYMILAYFYSPLRTLDAVLVFWIMGGVLTALIAAIIIRKWPWKQAFAAPLAANWYKTHIEQSWRIYLSDMISTATIYLDRYLITIFLSLELAGIYVLFWQVINAICNLVGASVLQVYRPRLILAYREEDNTQFKSLFWSSAYKTMGLTIFLSMASAIVVPFLIKFTDQPMAMQYLPLFWAMLGALLFRMGSDIGGYTLYAMHRDDLVLKAGILKLTLATISGIGALALLGIYGVIVTMIITGGGAMLYIASQWNEKRQSA